MIWKTGVFVVVRVGEGSFYTTNEFDQVVDNSATNGKSKSKRKEVQLWHVSKKTVNNESIRSYE